MQKITFYLQAVLLVIVAGSVFLTGCGPTLGYGRKFDTTNVKNIKKGVTTKAEILQMFDQPASKTISAGKESWMYTYSATTGRANAVSYVPLVGAFAGKTNVQSENSSLSLVFDKDVVKECTFSYGSSSSSVGRLSANVESTAPATHVTEPCGD